MLTRSGVATCAAALLSFATGRVFAIPELFVIGTGLVTAVVVGLASVAIRRPVPACARTVHPPMVSVGAVARVDLALHNSAARSTPRLSAWEQVGHSAGVQLHVAPLAAGESVSTAYRVPTTARGIVTIGPLRFERTDVFGLCVTRTMLAESLDVLVVPQVVPLRFPDPRSHGPVGDEVRARTWARSGTEFHSQREYVPGDDLRRINWKASARIGDLMVTEHAPESIRHCTVVLDPRLPIDGSDDQFELIASAAASVVTAATTAQVATRFLAPGIDLRGPTVAPETMQFLANARPDDATVDPAGTARGASDGLGLVVVVTALPLEPGWAAPDAVVVTIDVSGTRSGRMIVDGSSADHLASSWQRVVHGGTST